MWKVEFLDKYGNWVIGTILVDGDDRLKVEQMLEACYPNIPYRIKPKIKQFMKVEKLYSKQTCDKCKKEKATNGVLMKPNYYVVCEGCLKKLKYQDSINDMFYPGGC